jgi:hypothetical protein
LHRDAADARRRLHSELREMDWRRQ